MVKAEDRPRIESAPDADASSGDGAPDTDASGEIKPPVKPFSDDLLVRAVRGHPAIAVAGLVVAAGLVHVRSVAHGNPEVAIALLNYADAPNIVLALIAWWIPPMMAALAVFPWMVWIGKSVARRSFSFFDLYAPLSASALIVIISPEFIATPILRLYFACALGTILVVGVLRIRPSWGERLVNLFRSKDESKPIQGGSAFGLWMYITVIFIGLLTLWDRPWLPTELINPKDGEAFAGYVLGTSGSDLVVLYDEPRYVTHFSETNLDWRVPCQWSDEGNWKTLVQIWMGQDPGLLTDCKEYYE